MIHNHQTIDPEILEWGNHCDIDECEQALSIASQMQGTKAPFTWSDYTTSDDEWDCDKYYQDFMKWWEELGTKRRRMVMATMLLTTNLC